MRNLAKTIAAISVFAPANVNSLGIGDIKLHSALNQNLDAEISLIISAHENISNLQVRLAPPEKFDEAGVPWNYFLSKIKFESVTRADGSTIVKLSSREALREPFLDFLLEVTWDNGNLFREFTVLVDPPAAYTQPVLPSVQKAEVVTKAIENKPFVIEKVFAPSPQATTNEAKVYYSAEYGPILRKDNLWKVAEKTNIYDDVSIEQMMLAIYEANPKAFYQKNVNALMANKTLIVPERDVILKLSQRQARVAFKQHNNSWKGLVAAKVKKTEANATKEVLDENDLSTQLELEAPVEEDVSAKAVVVSKKIATVDVSHANAKPEDSGIAVNEESLALQARMAKLEEQLLLMQKMLALKDVQIAALQNRNKEEKATTTKKLPKAIAEQKPDIKQTVEDNTKKSEAKSTVLDKTDIKVAEKLFPKQPKVKPKPAVVPEAETETSLIPDAFILPFGIAGASILALLGLLWWRKKNNEEEIETESMFASASEISLPDTDDTALSVPELDDSSAYDVGTVGESSFLSEFTPSDFDAFDTDQSEVDPISEADVYLAYGRYQQAEELILQAIEDQPERDECKLKLLEVYYANENNAAFSAFALELVNSGKNKDQSFWDKVKEMGSELDPDSPLYKEGTNPEQVKSVVEVDSGGTENEDGAEKNESLSNETSDQTDFDLAVFDEGAKTVAEYGSAENIADNALDFDLSVFDLDESEAGIAEKTELGEKEVEGLETVDFDLDSVALEDAIPVEENNRSEENDLTEVDEIESFDFEMDADVNENVEKSDVREIEEDVESFDFSLDSEEPEIQITEVTPELDNEPKEEQSLEEFSFSLDDEEASGIKETNDIAAIVEVADDDQSLEDFDFDFDFEISSSTSDTTSDTLDEVDLGVTDLTDMDELETKLDLAKAYIDMGDADAAKDIAEEVLNKGSEEQKKSAQVILEQLK